MNNKRKVMDRQTTAWSLPAATNSSKEEQSLLFWCFADRAS